MSIRRDVCFYSVERSVSSRPSARRSTKGRSTDHTDESFDGMNTLINDEEGRKEGRRGPDYLGNCTGRYRRSFSHGMILNSDKLCMYCTGLAEGGGK